MKSITLYTCLIVILIVSTPTFGVKEEGTGTSASACAYASQGNDEDMDYESNWWCETAEEDGLHEWETTADAYAYCICSVNGGWGWAVADASGACASPFGVVSQDAYVYVDYTGKNTDDPPSDTDGGTDWFDEKECVSGQCDAFAYGAVEEGSSSTAFALAMSDGYVSLSEL